MSDDWKIWLSISGLVLATVTLISTAVALHNPHHYGAHSVAFAFVLTLGILVAITAVVNFIAWACD